MTTYICTLYYPPLFSPTVVFGAKTPTTTVGDTQDPPHSVLLPSEPIERSSQHSVAIQAPPTLFALRRGKGSRGGRGGGGRHELPRHTYICTHILRVLCVRAHVVCVKGHVRACVCGCDRVFVCVRVFVLCMRACVHACVCAFVRSLVRACMRACDRVFGSVCEREYLHT